MRKLLSGLGLALILVACGFSQKPQEYPEGVSIPRFLTKQERAWIDLHPLVVPDITSPPSGPIKCLSEFDPMSGILVAWEGSTAQNNIIASMSPFITGVNGNAKLIVVVDTVSEQTSASSTLQSAGANMSRVEFIVTTTDTIWIRDYGPRYVYVGGCRTIIDHTYNRPRPNDDNFPFVFAAAKQQQIHSIPLIHGGGNFQLDSANRGYATRLIANENTGLTESQIINHWLNYQSLTTTLLNPFPTTVDSTQHLDMWMQMASNNRVIISDWPNNVGSTQDNICDAAALSMATLGYTVYRVPAFSISGVHYTYTNSVICNNVVMVPTYTNTTVSPSNSTALAVFGVAFPGKQIVGIPSQNIIASAGAIHCITIQVPTNKNGEYPGTYLVSPNTGGSFTSGQVVSIDWLADDDNAVSKVDLYLEIEDSLLESASALPLLGGFTPRRWIPIAANLSNSMLFSWTVPNLKATRARIVVVATDAQGRYAWDKSDATFSIQ